MKIRPNFSGRRPVAHREGGMATLIFIVLLGIMMILMMVETHSLIRLHDEIRLLERQQIQRLNGPQTNAVSTLANHE